jgi:hypothetical protein
MDRVQTLLGQQPCIPLLRTHARSALTRHLPLLRRRARPLLLRDQAFLGYLIHIPRHSVNATVKVLPLVLQVWSENAPARLGR